MNIKQGYKQTEIGVIPEDWEVKTLEKLSDKIMVGIASAATHAYRDKGIVLFRNQNIKPNRLDDLDILFITPEYEEVFKNKRLKSGDLLTARTGYPGTTSLVPAKYEGSQSFTTLITRPNQKLIDSKYLCYFINSEEGQLYFEQNQIGGGQKNVNAASLKQMPIIIPTEKEQTAIAAALSDVDALMGELDKLIAKKRDIKQATMQQLLTGKKRLAGFSEEWEVTNLSTVCNESMQNGVFFKPSNKGFGIKIINVGDLYKASPIDIDSLELFNASNSEKERFSVKDGDLFFTRSSVVPSGIAHCNMYQSNQDEPVVFDSHVIRVRPNKQKIISLFLFRFCISSIARNYLVSHAKTGTMTTIDQNVLAKCPVYLPSIKEQTAIATILSDMDAEISQLEGRRAKMGELKQGMMQELLTGRIRLVSNENLLNHT